MTDLDKVKIKPFESGDDYRLWKIRIQAACDAKNLDDVLNRERNPYSTDTEKKGKFADDMRKASAIIVAALSNEPLRIIRTEIGKPYSMLKKLNERYDSKSAASRISKMIELVSLRYDNLSKDIGGHIDKMAGIVEQLAAMNTEIPNELAVALLIASIHVSELAPISAAIKTMSDEAATWDTVTTRLIEEQQSLKIKLKAERSSMATKRCEICHRKHFTKDCWLNPNNPNNRLQLRSNMDKDGKEKKKSKKTDKKLDQYPSHDKKRKALPKEPRAAVARATMCNTVDDTRMMLDSGTTTHMIPNEVELQSAEDCTVSISLGDDSSVQATSKGVKPVTWNGPEGPTEVHLSETLAARDLAMRLLSVPALTRKGMAVLFLPDKALIVDLRDNHKVIGIARKSSDGLYYIGTENVDNVDITHSASDRAMMAVVRQFTDTVDNCDFVLDSSVDSPDSDMENRETTCYIGTSSDDGDSSTDDGGLEGMPALWAEDEDDSSSSDDEDYSTTSSESDDESEDDKNDGVPDLCYDSDDEDEFSSDITAPDYCGMVKPTVDDVAIWHNRLGHQGSRTGLQDMIKDGTLPFPKQCNTNCDPCNKGKFRRFFRGSLTKETQPGKIHADLVGRVKPRSLEGYEYFLTIVDEATRYAETTPLRRKSDASLALIDFMKRFERQAGVKLRALHTDEGSEFFKARTHFEDIGVKVTTSTAYTPTSNGLVERTQGVLLSSARSCLDQAKLPLHYWPYAIEHATKSRNVIVHSATHKAPYTALFGHKADYLKHLRPFGCRVLVQPVKKKIGKLEGRLIEGICLNHVDGGIYKVLTASGMIQSKHLRFFESTFPGTTLLNKQMSPSIISDVQTTLKVDRYSSDEDEHRTPVLSPGEQPEVTMLGGQENVPVGDVNHDVVLISGGEAEMAEYHITDEQLEQVTYQPANPSTFGESTDASDQDEESEASDDPDWEPAANAAIPQNISTSDEPAVAEAMRSPEAIQWKQAIAEEFKTLDKAGTWTDHGTPPTNALPSGFILKLKRDEQGLPSKFKARLVARGNLQRKENYTQENRYAPVACFDLVRIMIALSAAFDWKRHQVDVKGAFLHSRLPKDSDIWIRLPKVDGIPRADGSVVKLVKSLYGLREAPKLWYQTLSTRLIEMGFERIKASDCLFMLRKGRAIVILLAYVDDLGLFGDEKLIKFVKAKLGKCFQVTDLGESTHFLGVVINETQLNISLTQKPLIHRIMKLANMGDCKPVKTPLPVSHILYEARVEPSEAEQKMIVGVPYKEVLGSLLFLSTRTRPDISTAVSMLGKFAASPLPRHWKAMKHVVRYLSGTQDYGLIVEKGSGIELEAWSDADWGRDEDKRRSRSGVLITIGNNPVIWTSKLQPTVALSTAEAEFYALSECIREINWVRQILAELGFNKGTPTCVFQDNLGTITWTKEVQGLRKVKHVRLRYHFVKEAVQQKDVEVLYTPSIENKADGLTKALGEPAFLDQRTKQRVMSSSFEEGVSQN